MRRYSVLTDYTLDLRSQTRGQARKKAPAQQTTGRVTVSFG